MANEQPTPQVAIPLPSGKRTMVNVGCVCMMLSVAMFGYVYSTLAMPILSGIGAESYFSLFALFGGLGIAIMTPIGGKLSDLIGRRNIVVIPGIVCIAAGIGLAFANSTVPVLGLRLLMAMAQGAFTAAPYITVSLVNESKRVPTMMGLLATSVALGGFGGSIIAGILTDMGMMLLAVLMPNIPLLLGVVLIGLSMPNVKKEGKISVDIPGIVTLVVALCGILVALNFGSSIGWTNPAVLAGFVVGIIALVALIKVEGKAADPIIPLKLFKNANYTVLLLVGFICYFYQAAMSSYAPIGVMQVMGGSTTVAGALQMPRTILTMILPTIAGAWVGRKAGNAWKAMTIGTLFAALPMAVMGFTSPSYPVIIYFVALGLTGIAESFRSVSITPSAQAALDPRDIGIGTSLVNFCNTLSSTIAAAVMGVAYNLNTAADPTDPALIQNGVNAVFWVSAVVSAVGFLIVIFVVRPQMTKKAAA